MPLPLQDVLEGKYEILEKIGEGGIGAVYKVRHRLLDEIRVVKVLRAQAASKTELQERFLNEARMAIRLKHPNIAQLHDFSIAEDGRAYIVMEFIDGVSLDALIKASGPPSIELALEISRQALDALHYLHEHQFVHRDVSPDNLMLTTSFDGRPMVKLIDLGIAKHLDEEVNLTATGVFLGKARYCSPEQFSAGGEAGAAVDRRSDVYSFGVLLYELLTGVHPVRGESFAELAGSHLFQPPRDFAKSDPEGRVGEPLRAVVLQALEKDPADRHPTAAAFAEALAEFQDPGHSFQEEFDRSVELSTVIVPLKDYSRPGSTQERLNEEFGLRPTPAPPHTATEVADRTATPASAVQEVDTLLSRGRWRSARRRLDRAMEVHGELPSLVQLDLRLRSEQPAPASRPPKRLLAVAGGALVLALALVALWLQLPAGGARTAATRQSAVAIEPTPRWDPSAVGGSAWPAAPPASSEPAAGTGPDPGAPPAAAGRAGDPGEGPGPPPAAEPAVSAPEPAAPTLQVSLETFERDVGVIPPVIEFLPDPVAPRQLTEELVVEVEALVDETGKVLTARVVRGPSFRRRFREAALEAVKEARFRPAQRGNTVGRMWTIVPVVFKPAAPA